MLSRDERRIISRLPEKGVIIAEDGPFEWHPAFKMCVQRRTYLFDALNYRLTGKEINPLLPLQSYFLSLRRHGTEVKEALLMGSFAMGLAHPKSDLDIAARLVPVQEDPFLQQMWEKINCGLPLHFLQCVNPADFWGAQNMISAGGKTLQFIVGKSRNLLEGLA